MPDGKSQSAGIHGEGAPGGFEEGALLPPHMENWIIFNILSML